jgi:hypothetical protein
MTEPFRNCSNCGGRVEPSADGRIVSCAYCGSGSSVAIDPRALAAGIAGDTKSLHAGFERLATVLRQTFPSHTTVRESGLFSKKITSFDVTLGDFTFRLSRERAHVVAHRVTTVRGIVLRTETMSLEEWLTALAEKLSEMARSNTAAREAFARIATE